MSEDKDIEIVKKIDKYIKGELSQKEIDELWVNFLENPEYYDLFEADLHLRDLAKKGENPFEDSPSNLDDNSMWNSYTTWALAAAAAVILGLLLQLFTIGLPKTASDLALTSIDHTELSGADVLRSDEEDVSDLNVTINQALSMVYSDEADEAIEIFRNLLNEPLDAEQRARVEMNLGILQYNKAEYPEAKIHFMTVLEANEIPTHIEEKAWWYLGNTHLNLEEIEEAREAVFNTYTMDGRFQHPALLLLKRLDLQLGNISPDVERLNTQ